MKRIFYTAVISFSVVLTFSSWSSASEFIDTAVFTIKNSPECNIALKDVDIARSDKDVVWSKYLPHLSGKVEGGAAHEEYQDSLNNFGDTSASVSLSQELVDVSQIFAIKGAVKKVAVAESQVIQVKQDILLEFARAWGEYWKALQQEDVNKENVTILQAYLDGAKIRYEAGEITITDVQLAEARFQTSLSQRIRFIREANRAKDTLEKQIGKAVPENVELFYLLMDEIIVPEQELAVSEHPAMLPMVQELSALDNGIDEQRARHMPTLKTLARYKYQPDGEYDSSRYSYNESYIGLELNVPIYLGGEIFSRTRKAFSEKERQQLKIQDLHRELVRNIQTAKTNYGYSAEEYDITVKRLKYAEDTLKWMTEEYKAGTKSSVDVFLIQADMITAKLDVIEAREQHTWFIFSYLHSLGLLNIDTLETYQVK